MAVGLASGIGVATFGTVLAPVGTGTLLGVANGLISEERMKSELGDSYDPKERSLRITNSAISGTAGGAMFLGTHSITAASGAAGAASGFLDGVTHWDKKQKAIDNLKAVSQKTSVGLTMGTVGGAVFEYTYGLNMFLGMGSLGSFIVAGGVSSGAGGIAGRLHQGMLNMQGISDIGLLAPAFDGKAIRNDIEWGTISAAFSYGTLRACQGTSNYLSNLQTSTQAALSMGKNQICEQNGGTSLMSGMPPEKAATYPKLLTGGSRAGLITEKQPGTEQSAQGRVNYDEVLQGRNGANKGGSGVLNNANYAQKTYSNTFSAEGRKIYSDLAGEPINTIDDLVNAINSGKVNVADLPVEYIVRDGNTLILNTRTSQALTQAGIPRNQWNAIDRTGDTLFEELLTGQLSRNKLTSEGISTVRPSGGQ